MGNNRKQVGFEVDADAYEEAQNKTEWGGLSQQLRKKVHEVAYGTEVTERKRLKEKLERLRKEKREVTQEIDDLRHERDEKEREISRVEERLDVLMEDEGEFDGYLQALETDLHSGKRVDPQHAQVEKAADLGDCDPQEVIDALMERNSDVPQEAFRDAKLHEEPNWKKEHTTTTTSKI